MIFLAYALIVTMAKVGKIMQKMGFRIATVAYMGRTSSLNRSQHLGYPELSKADPNPCV